MQTIESTTGRRILQYAVASGIAVMMIPLSSASARAPGARASGPAEQCRTVSGQDATALLHRAAGVMGLDSIGDRVRRSTLAELTTDQYEADRMYPPTAFRNSTTQLAIVMNDNMVGRLRLVPPNAPSTVTGGISVTDGDRPMDPWMVIADWIREPRGAKVTQECFYRDYWRTVITRADTAGGQERLFIDGKSGYPVKMDRRERHYLFGDRFSEYVWSTWQRVGPAAAPRFAFLVADGETDRAWTQTGFILLPRDSVNLTIIKPQLPPAAMLSIVPDTVRIGANTFALKTASYTNVVTLQHDTVYIFDAQTSEDRAQQDSVWIGKLFPGRHPLRLVVTDLAWPHIAGVRYWVGNGVPILTHTASRDFLLRVINHKWTQHPDKLEKMRATVHPVIRTIDAPLTLAGGSLVVVPIDGIASEGALMGYVPAEHALYVGDYVQPENIGVQPPGALRFTYLDEVLDAVKRNHFDPVMFASMHVSPTAWSSAVASH